MALLMEIAAAKRDADQVRSIPTHPSQIDRLAAGVAGILAVSLGRRVDNTAVPKDRVNQAPED
jgi:hypothetical protein